MMITIIITQIRETSAWAIAVADKPFELPDVERYLLFAKRHASSRYVLSACLAWQRRRRLSPEFISVTPLGAQFLSMSQDPRNLNAIVARECLFYKVIVIRSAS